MPTINGRSQAVAFRTYQRPLNEAGTQFESWDDVASRCFDHQWNLWENTGRTPDEYELSELLTLIQQKRGLLSGRTLWLGGTDYGRTRACSNFNCSYLRLGTVYDIVDAAWLLLNGCGVGGKPIPGTLHGYLTPIKTVEVVPSIRSKDYKGRQHNIESFENGEWRISCGDSAEAWAKLIGKLLNPPTNRITRLVLDFTEVRGAGSRLRGYGWICNGSRPLIDAVLRIHEILNRKAGQLLDEIDILDIFNHIGTVLSSRRSAEIALLDYGSPRWLEFAEAKLNYWEDGNEHRRQSNNTLLFWNQPNSGTISGLLHSALHGGDPGFANGEAARRRAPWFDGCNPCAEILLPSRGFCNLVTACVPAFGKDLASLERAIYLLARANYRQTCVDLDDGLLSPEWDQTNQALRLCGTSLSGLAQAEWLIDYDIHRLRNAATTGAYSMADELDLPRPKAVTTIKPEGTSSKVFNCTEGIHKPLGRYLFNWINYSKHDLLVEAHRTAGYTVIDNPYEQDNALICFPVDYKGVRLGGTPERPINTDSAVVQLERYKRWVTLWADHNVSCTISMSKEEIPEVTDWLLKNWDNYVAVSFLPRTTNLTAKEAGHKYLPQEVVSKDQFDDYSKALRPVDYTGVTGIHDLTSADCANGVCPVR